MSHTTLHNKYKKYKAFTLVELMLALSLSLFCVSLAMPCLLSCARLTSRWVSTAQALAQAKWCMAYFTYQVKHAGVSRFARLNNVQIIPDTGLPINIDLKHSIKLVSPKSLSKLRMQHTPVRGQNALLILSQGHMRPSLWCVQEDGITLTTQQCSEQAPEPHLYMDLYYLAKGKDELLSLYHKALHSRHRQSEALFDQIEHLSFATDKQGHQVSFDLTLQPSSAPKQHWLWVVASLCDR